MVLDTSAIMAFLRDEVGADMVASMLEDRAIISTVNVQELVASLALKGMAPEDARLAVRSLNLEGRDFTWDLAERATELVEWTKPFGLKAWAFVKSSVQGPRVRCWLKSVVPSQIHNNCCVSGVKDAGGRPEDDGSFVQPR